MTVEEQDRPNADTMAAMKELEDGGGEYLELSRTGTHSDLFDG